MKNRGDHEWGAYSGFTLVELVMIILLLSVLAVTAFVKWPTGMDIEAANLELKQAVRYAQHLAMTRQWTSDNEAWGISVAGNRYYVGRHNGNCQSSCSSDSCGEAGFCDRYLTGDTSMTLVSSIASNEILFNGYGEPIDETGALLGNVTFTIGGEGLITVCRETGYPIEGGACP